MDQFKTVVEELKVTGNNLVEQVRKLLHEGNVRRIIIRDEKGNTFLEIPLTIAAVGVIAAPVLTAIGALAAMAVKFTIVTVRSEPTTETPPSQQASGEAPSEPTVPTTIP
jgi:hypothetical protein